VGGPTIEYFGAGDPWAARSADGEPVVHADREPSDHDGNSLGIGERGIGDDQAARRGDVDSAFSSTGVLRNIVDGRSPTEVRAPDRSIRPGLGSPPVYEEIARNKRRSRIYVGLFLLTWLLLGVLLGVVIVTVVLWNERHQHPPFVNPLGNWTYLVGICGGAAVAMVMAVISLLCVLNSGYGMVLRNVRAVPADPWAYWGLIGMVEALAVGRNIPCPAIFVTDDPFPNAFATGLAPDQAALVVTSGLLATMDREELQGVLAHELSHIANDDIRYLFMSTVLMAFPLLLLSNLARRSEQAMSPGLIVLVIFVLMMGFPIILLLFTLLASVVGSLYRFAISRKREFLADASAVELTRLPSALRRALQTVVYTTRFSDSAPGRTTPITSSATRAMCFVDPGEGGGRWSRLRSTHPPIGERIAALDRMERGETV